MPTPFSSRQITAPLAEHSTTTSHDWRCTRCQKLLGICRDGRMHLRFSHGHEYFTGFPVEAICRGCTTLNRFAGATASVALPQR